MSSGNGGFDRGYQTPADVAASAQPPAPSVVEVSASEFTGESGGEDITAGWVPVDLAGTLQGLREGTLTRPEPTVGDLGTGGGALFYPGRVNGIHGDSTAGKTWTALVTCRQELAKGEAVVYVDLEDDPAGIVGRLLDLGADPAAVRDRFAYVRPEGRFNLAAADAMVRLLAERRPSVAVIDSTGEALALQGANPNADEEVAQWFRALPRLLAHHGVAVVLTDHAVKSGDGGLWPIGSQRKRAAITGAAYLQRQVKPFSRDRDGLAVLTCAKDRGGRHALGQKVAELVVTGGGFSLRAAQPGADEPGTFRPTVLMARASSALQLAGEPLTFNGIADRTCGKRQHVRTALDVLVSEGWVSTEPGPNRSTLHRLVRPYSEADDDGEPLGAKNSPEAVVSGSGSLGGEPGTTTPSGSGNHRGTTGNHLPTGEPLTYAEKLRDAVTRDGDAS